MMKNRILTLIISLISLSHLSAASTGAASTTPTFRQLCYLLSHTAHSAWTQQWVRDFNNTYFKTFITSSRSVERLADTVMNGDFSNADRSLSSEYTSSVRMYSTPHAESKVIVLGMIFRRLCSFNGAPEFVPLDRSKEDKCWGYLLKKYRVLPSPRPFICSCLANDIMALPTGSLYGDSADNRTVGEMVRGILMERFSSGENYASHIVAALNSNRSLFGTLHTRGVVTEANLYSVLEQMERTERQVSLSLPGAVPLSERRALQPDAGIRAARVVAYYGEQAYELPEWRADQTWEEYVAIARSLINSDGAVQDWPGKYRNRPEYQSFHAMITADGRDRTEQQLHDLIVWSIKDRDSKNRGKGGLPISTMPGYEVPKPAVSPTTVTPASSVPRVSTGSLRSAPDRAATPHPRSSSRPWWHRLIPCK